MAHTFELSKIASQTIEQTIYNYWHDTFGTKESFEKNLLDFDKEELVEFIINAQSRGAFKKIIHP